MPDHMCEWVLNEGDGTDDVEYIECRVCHKCLSPLDALPMLNAAEPKEATSLDDIVMLVERAMQCLEAIGEGLYTETFDEEITEAFNTLDDALSTLKPQIEHAKARVE